MRILFIALSLVLIFGCTSIEQAQASSDYSLAKVSQAASSALDKARKDTEFYLYNIPPGTNAEPEVILKFIRDCHMAGRAGAIASDRLEGIYDVVQAALSERKDERFNGFILIIVAAKKDPERFDALLLPHGITPVYATY